MTMDDRVGMTPGWPAGDNAMSNLLAQNWWAIALRGVFAILFGIIALLMPGAALLAFVLLFGKIPEDAAERVPSGRVAHGDRVD
jgi:hypothetical protein